MTIRTIRRTVAALLLVPALLISSSLSGYAQAALMTTDSVVEKYGAEAERARLSEVFSRAEVQAEFQKLGVSEEEAQARLAAMSDAEVQQLAAQIDSAPAGQGAAGAIVGAALVVFLVLLATDILCLTDVFPFTRCSR